MRPCDYYAEFEQPKIIAPAIVSAATFALDHANLYSNDKTTIISHQDPLYLMGILNCTSTTLWLRLKASTKQGGYFEQKPVYLSAIPIPRLDLDDPGDCDRHDRLVSLVEEMLDLHRLHAEAERSLDDARHGLARRIEATDRKIDALVYELYGLTEEEIAIVEGARA